MQLVVFAPQKPYSPILHYENESQNIQREKR